MTRRKRKSTASEKKAMRERQKNFKWIFINGKQVRVKREPEIDGLPVDEWLRQNADPLWLIQNVAGPNLMRSFTVVAESPEGGNQRRVNPDVAARFTPMPLLGASTNLSTFDLVECEIGGCDTLGGELSFPGLG